MNTVEEKYTLESEPNYSLENNQLRISCDELLAQGNALVEELCSLDNVPPIILNLIGKTEEILKKKVNYNEYKNKAIKLTKEVGGNKGAEIKRLNNRTMLIYMTYFFDELGNLINNDLKNFREIFIQIDDLKISEEEKIAIKLRFERLKCLSFQIKKIYESVITKNPKLVASRLRKMGILGWDNDSSSHASKFNTLSPMDLYRIGQDGLLIAFKNFDVKRNISFATFAVPHIFQQIQYQTRLTGKEIYIPAQLYNHFMLYKTNPAEYIRIYNEDIAKGSADAKTDPKEFELLSNSFQPVYKFDDLVKQSADGDLDNFLDRFIPPDVRDIPDLEVNKIDTIIGGLSVEDRLLYQLIYIKGNSFAKAGRAIGKSRGVTRNLHIKLLRTIENELATHGITKQNVFTST
jgi:DNA-directed RNA polymerase specialized sigma subunit